jgi:hypothetical protein
VLDARQRAHDGQPTELLVPAANVSVRRALQVSGLTEVRTVREASELDWRPAPVARHVASVECGEDLVYGLGRLMW